MNMFPWQLLLVTLTGWTNQHQLRIIEYQQEEIRVLRELHGKRRLRFPTMADTCLPFRQALYCAYYAELLNQLLERQINVI